MAIGTVTNPADPDLWHRLAVGEYISQKGHLPSGEVFSYQADYKEVVDHEWGSALIFYALWQWGGATAMVATKLATLAVTLVLVVWAGLQGSRPTILLGSFYALVLLALLPSFQSTVRCMVFTHIFFALWVGCYQRERHGYSAPTYVYVLTMLLWANLHGGFVIGLVWLLSITLIEAFRRGTWRRWAIRFGLCALVTLINPFGLLLWVVTGRALLVSRQGFDEWAPVPWDLNLFSYPGYKVLFVGVLSILGIQLYRKGWKEIDQPAVILIGLFLILSMTSARHTSLFAVVAGAFTPSLLSFRWTYVLRVRPLRRLVAVGINFALILVPLLTALRVLPGAQLTLEYPTVSTPIGAVAYLQRQSIQGRLLVPFNYGSFAMWELRGRMRVSMDGRYDLVYRPETYRRVDNFFRGEGDWKSLLISPAPDAILVPRTDAVYSKIQNLAAWKEVWRDGTDAVFLPR